MIRSLFDWFARKGEKMERRRRNVPDAVFRIGEADIDPMTGALRWDRFMVMLEAEQAQAPGVLLLIDLSTRSEDAAVASGQGSDEILPWLAGAIGQAIRSDDLLAHVEGFRFAVLLRGAPQAVGATVAERILESVDDTIFMTAEGIVRLGVTVGGAAYAQGSEGDPVEEALSNLGIARQLGRGIVVQ